MNVFNEKEFVALCQKLNGAPRIKEVTLKEVSEGYFNKVATSVKTDRRGEVVFCVIRPNGRAILITCSEYPEGIYRIPTGGIGHEEDILEAVHREAKEELGLDTEIIGFDGVLKIKFQHKNESVMFYSYLFIVRETGGRLLLDATDDEISQVEEADINGLIQAAEKLKSIQGSWHDWGLFRYETTHASIEYLQVHPDLLKGLD